MYSYALSKQKTKTMASNNISVNDTVQIDGQGYGIVTEVIFRGFATFNMVRLLDSSFEVELERERLTAIDLDKNTEIYPEIGEVREIHEIPEDELSPLLCRFIVGVRKQNGEDYEPSVLRGMISSFDRQLWRKAYPQTISQGPAFA